MFSTAFVFSTKKMNKYKSNDTSPRRVIKILVLNIILDHGEKSSRLLLNVGNKIQQYTASEATRPRYKK